MCLSMFFSACGLYRQFSLLPANELDPAHSSCHGKGEPRICVGWPSSPLSSCPKVFLFKARRVCLHCGTWPLFPHARRFSQTWPATGLDPPSTRWQPPQRTGSSGICSSSRTWTTKARTRGTQLDSSRASRRVRVTWSISSGSKTCHSRIGS